MDSIAYGRTVNLDNYEEMAPRKDYDDDVEVIVEEPTRHMQII